ncbi:MAG: 50S ribosomal protein L4, partial [Patescibacteria group bacterium]
VGKVNLPPEIFGIKWNERLIQQVVEAQLANRRRPWAHAKGRGEVSGGGRKPWRQKGTGRARHGSTRSPIWVGGGKAHGPNKMRDYSQKVNKKMKSKSIFTALSKKLKDSEIKVFDTLAIQEPKTRILSQKLRPILGLAKAQKRFDVLIVADKENKNVMKASRNLPKTKATAPESLNLYDILNYKNIFIDRDSIGTIGRHFSSKIKNEKSKIKNKESLAKTNS